MKKIILALFSCLTILGVPSFAKKINGELFFKNDTIEATLHIPMEDYNSPNFEAMQFGISYTENSSGKTIPLDPRDVMAFRFKIDTTEYKIVSVHNYFNFTKKAESPPGMLKLGDASHQPFSARIFLKQELEGKINVYAHYYQEKPIAGVYNAYTAGGNYISKKRFIVERNDQFKKSDWLKEKENLEKYLSDCEEVITLLHSEESKKKGLLFIFNYYNHHCL